MVKKFRIGKKRIQRNSLPEQMGQNIFTLLKAMGGSPEKARLASLWTKWSEVVGEDFCWVIPLGHHDKTLLLGVEDAMEIQELGMQSPLILEKVNTYLEREYFSRLRIYIYTQRD